MERENNIIKQQLHEECMRAQEFLVNMQNMSKQKRMSRKEARRLKELFKHNDLHKSLVKYYRLQPIQL